MQINDKVEILVGAFKGQVGTIVDISDKFTPPITVLVKAGTMYCFQEILKKVLDK